MNYNGFLFKLVNLIVINSPPWCAGGNCTIQFRNCKNILVLSEPRILGPVVQRKVSTNAGLKLIRLYSFMYFYTSVPFKTSETEILIDPDTIYEEILSSFMSKLWEGLLWISLLPRFKVTIKTSINNLHRAAVTGGGIGKKKDTELMKRLHNYI